MQDSDFAEEAGALPPLMLDTQLTDKPVRNLEGEDVGKIENLMIDIIHGRVAYAVLSFGGFLGMGNKLFAIPWESLSLDPEAWSARWAGAEVSLTVTEFTILRTLATTPTKVFSRDAIIDRLRGPGFAVTDRTIDSHVRNLRGKFAQVGGCDVIETRAGVGYQLGACTGQTARAGG